MKALVIRQPYASQIMFGSKKIEYRSWHPGKVTDFLVVSSAKSQQGTFDLMLPKRTALATVHIDRVSQDDDIYAWHLTVTSWVKPFLVKGKLGWLSIDDRLIHQNTAVLADLKSYRCDKIVSSRIEPFEKELSAIAMSQMPKTYAKVLADSGLDELYKIWQARHQHGY